MAARGRFLSLDGSDGTGKSTQCRLLADWLRSAGLTVVTCADPGGTPVGSVLRELLLGHRHEVSLPCEAFLFLASRAQLVATVIRPALESGHWVVSDRYSLATVVYQGHAGGLDAESLGQAGELATGGLRPDLTVVLDAPPDVTTPRMKATRDRLESRPADFHRRVRDGFLAEAAKHPDRIDLVSAEGSVDDVHRRLRDLLTRRFPAELGALNR